MDTMGINANYENTLFEIIKSEMLLIGLYTRIGDNMKQKRYTY